MALKQNTWTLNNWYAQDVAGNAEYNGDRQLWMWGRNIYGNLGQNNETNYSSPKQVPGSTWSALPRDVGGNMIFASVAVKTDGTLWTWGHNEHGQLGQNSETKYSSPVQVPGTTWSQDPAQISKGRCVQVIKTDGTLWSWGYNWQGQDGNNTALNHRSSPTQVGSDTNWSKLGQARTTPLAIKTDGTLWSWGGNQFGTQGQNDRTSRSSPIQIPGTTWNDVAGGLNTVIATKTDGTLWMWGDQAESGGILGQNNTTQYSSPVQVGSDTTWNTGDLKIATNKYATAAIKTDGTLWAWGSNYYGNLGQGNSSSNAQHSSPVQIPGTDWNKISNFEEAGFYVIKTNGELWTWGRGSYGALAQGNETTYSSPKQIPGTDWTQVTGEGYYGYAIKNI